MADQRKRISELPASSSLDNLYTIGVDANNDSVKVPIGQIINNTQNAVNNATGAITPRLFINADTVLGIRSRRLDTVIELLENRNDIGTFRVKGVVLTFTGVNGLESWQWSGQNWSNPQNWMPYRYSMQKLDNEEQMDAMRANGTADPTVIYYTEEE